MLKEEEIELDKTVYYLDKTSLPMDESIGCGNIIEGSIVSVFKNKICLKLIRIYRIEGTECNKSNALNKELIIINVDELFINKKEIWKRLIENRIKYKLDSDDIKNNININKSKQIDDDEEYEEERR